MDSNDLVKKLSPLKSLLSHSGEGPFSGNIRFTPKRAWTFDGEIMMAVTCETGLDCVVPGMILLDLLGSLGDSPVDFSLVGETLTVTSGKTKAKINCVKTPAFPKRKLPTENWTDINPLLMAILPTLTDFCANSLTVPLLACVHSTETFIESCDGLRAIRYHGNYNLGTALLRASAAKMITTFNMSQYAYDDGWMFLCNDDTGILVMFQLDTGVYPDINVVLEDKGVEYTIPDEVKPAIKRALLFIDESKNLRDIWIKLEWSGKALTVSRLGAKGQCVDSFPVKAAKEFTACVSPEALLLLLDFKKTLVFGEKTVRAETKGCTCCAMIHKGNNA